MKIKCQDQCPTCGSDQITWSNMEPPQDTGGLMSQQGTCDDCHKLFDEYFTYSHTITLSGE